jgi:hypothetical protein
MESPKEVPMERDKLINIWAKVDTLAFVAFLPIRRKMLEGDEGLISELYAACSLAVIAVDLADELDKLVEKDLRRIRTGIRA